MYPRGNGNADLGYNKHSHVRGHGLGHGSLGRNQFLPQHPLPLAPPLHRFPLPVPGPVPVPVAVAPLNPLVVPGPLAQEVSGGIDWAQLAQQWIHMRDTGSVMAPVAPPPPIIGNVPEYHPPPLAIPFPSALLEEHGEADMDMDEEMDRSHGAETPPPPAPVVTQSQWLAASEGSTPDPAAPASKVSSSGAAAPHGNQPWNTWQSQSGTTSNPTAHIPSLLKLNVSNPNEPEQQLQLHQPLQPSLQQQQQQQHQHPQQHPQQPESESHGGVSSEIDANKRKMLPAWIREGLEKMEREKQRQLERHQQLSSAPTAVSDVQSNQVKQVSSKILTTPVILNSSHVASDSEDSIELPEEAPGKATEGQTGSQLSKASGGHSSDDKKEDYSEQEPQEALKRTKVSADNSVNGKSYEDRLSALMLVVRRTLTEILLEATNEEIAGIAGETLKAHRAKASSAQVIRKSALSSITGNLGLAAYDSDSSSNSEAGEIDDGEDRLAEADKDTDKSVHLSVEELKVRIRRCKRSFASVIDDIEDRMAKQKERDEQILNKHRQREIADTTREHRNAPINSEPLKDDGLGPRPHDKLQHINACKRPSRRERTTRFSDNKDGKQPHGYVQQVVAAVAPLSNNTGASAGPPKLKPVPNPATNLLQMPESVTSMLNAADKALYKANKSTRNAKNRRGHSSSSSSSSSDSSSSDSDSNSSKSKASSGRSKRRGRHGRREQGRRDRVKGRDRDRDRGRSRDWDSERHKGRHHYVDESSSHHRQRESRHRDSSHSAEDEGLGKSSRQRTGRSHDSRSSGRQKHRTRSRSKSRSTHHSHSNSSVYSTSTSAQHVRKRR